MTILKQKQKPGNQLVFCKNQYLVKKPKNQLVTGNWYQLVQTLATKLFITFIAFVLLEFI